MPYMMRRDIAEDGAFLEQVSHEDLELNSGQRLPADVSGPIEFAVDPEIDGGGVMPTLFDIPTLVARNAFVELLRANGVDNIEVLPARIENPATGSTIPGYSYVNIVGVVQALSLEESEISELGDDVRLVDKPVLVGRDLGQVPRLFRLAEDTLRIVIDDSLADAIRASNLEDVYLENVEMK